MPHWAQIGLSLMAGIVGGTVAPMVTWVIEIYRSRRAERARRMTEWRQGLYEWEIEWRQFRESITDPGTRFPVALDVRVWFSYLRSHLAPETIETIRSQEYTAPTNSGTHQTRPVALLIADELDRLDKKWRLS